MLRGSMHCRGNTMTGLKAHNLCKQGLSIHREIFTAKNIQDDLLSVLNDSINFIKHRIKYESRTHTQTHTRQANYLHTQLNT